MKSRRAHLAGRLAACLCLAAAALPVAARATTTNLGALPAAADRMTAYGGYALFSARSAQGSWSLMAWHAGSIAALPVPARTIPFDAEAGPGPDGRPVVVFSKCTREPRVQPHGDTRFAADLEWQTAAGCRIYELSLPGGTPRLIARIRPRGASFDATPAIWRGEIAFARYGPSGPPQILLSGAAGTGHLGGGPASCPAPSTISGAPLCRRGERLVRSRVAGISLSVAAAVYEWVAEVPGAFVGPLADPEIRLDPLRGARQSAPTKLLDMGFASGACGGGSESSATAVGGQALYLEESYACEAGPERMTSKFVFAAPTGRPRSAGTGGHILALALGWDRGTAYWMGFVPRPEAPHCSGNPVCERGAESQPACPPQSVCDTAQALPATFGCEPAEGVCTLMRTTGLAPARAVRRARSGAPARLSAAGQRRIALPGSRPHAGRH